MKKYFNKSIFKDKSFIKMICFTIVLLLVLILGNTFGYVSAEEITIDDNYVSSGWGDSYDSDLNFTDYSNSSLYNPNVSTSHIAFSGTEFNVYDYFDALSSNMPSQIGNSASNDFGTYNPIDADYGSYPSYLIRYMGINSGNYEITMWLFPSSECYYCFNKVLISADSWDYRTVPYYRIIFRFDSSGNYVGGFANYYYLNNPSTYNGYIYVPELASVSVYGIDICNFSMIAELSDYSSSFNNDTNITNYLNGDNSFYTEINYMISDGNYSGIGTDNSGGSGGANASNYMFADSADWYLNNFNGQIQDKYRTVSAVFTSNLNDYINDSLILGDINTDSEYTIDFDFYADVEFYYSYVVGVDDTNLPSVTIGNSFVSSSIDSSGDGEGYNNTYKWACSYDAPASMGNYLSGMHVDASTFADNNYTMSFPLSSLFAYMEPSNSYIINPNGEKSQITITLQQLMYMWANGFIGRNNSLVSEQFNLSKFNLTCKATINYGDAFTDLGHLGEYESGSYTETFDLLSGQSTVDDDSMLTNYNPYVDNTSEDYSNLPSTETNGSNSNSTTVTTGNVTQTVNVSNEGASYIPSLINKLIPTSLSDTGTGLVSTFSTMAQTNGFISVMASTVPAIPSTVWTYLTNYLGISLYLLACAFVLRLILDLL